MKLYLAVMISGALGVASRLWISTWFSERVGETFPFGTMVVNVSGCLLIGIFGGLTKPDGVLIVSPIVRQMIMIGLLGGFTTFSSFTWQTLTLVEDGEWLYASLNIIGSVVLCLAAVWGGFATANLLNQQ